MIRHRREIRPVREKAKAASNLPRLLRLDVGVVAWPQPRTPFHRSILEVKSTMSTPARRVMFWVAQLFRIGVGSLFLVACASHILALIDTDDLVQKEDSLLRMALTQVLGHSWNPETQLVTLVAAAVEAVAAASLLINITFARFASCVILVAIMAGTLLAAVGAKKYGMTLDSQVTCGCGLPEWAGGQSLRSFLTRNVLLVVALALFIVLSKACSPKADSQSASSTC